MQAPHGSTHILAQGDAGVARHVLVILGAADLGLERLLGDMIDARPGATPASAPTHDGWPVVTGIA
jgi:hypothetical protein